MMLDVKRLKTIKRLSVFCDLVLFELVFYSNYRKYLIIRGDRILFEYLSKSWANKKFDSLVIKFFFSPPS